MDVDLSTDLAALAPLVAPLISGHSDLAIGTRLGRGATGGAWPQARDHLALLQPDPQIHARRRILRRTVRFQGDPRRRRTTTAAARHRHRLVLRHRTAGPRRTQRAADPRGAGRLGRRPRQPGGHRRHRDGRPEGHRHACCAASPTARSRCNAIAAQLGSSRDVRGAGLAVAPGRAVRVPSGSHRRPPTCCCSCCCTARSAPRRRTWSRCCVTAIGNTAANRRFTFGVAGSKRVARHHVEGLIVFAIALAITSGSLALLHTLDARTAAVHRTRSCWSLANLLATAVRFVLLRGWVFHPRRNR